MKTCDFFKRVNSPSPPDEHPDRRRGWGWCCSVCRSVQSTWRSRWAAPWGGWPLQGVLSAGVLSLLVRSSKLPLGHSSTEPWLRTLTHAGVELKLGFVSWSGGGCVCCWLSVCRLAVWGSGVEFLVVIWSHLEGEELRPRTHCPAWNVAYTTYKLQTSLLTFAFY